MSKFVGRLITTRTLERGVQFFGPTKESVETAARKWLECHGEDGDSFHVFGWQEVVVGEIGYVEAVKK